jgi:tetratricopeptide (TPR) repeat protein
MADPARTLLLEIEEQCSHLSGVTLLEASGGDLRLGRLRLLFQQPVSSGYAAFISRYNGGRLGRSKGQSERIPAVSRIAVEEETYLELLTFEDSQKILRETHRGIDWKGLWPVASRGARIFALDFEATQEGEQPVVEAGERSVDRVGSTFLRFLSACLGEITLGEEALPLTLARELCHRDPGLAEHWVHLVDFLEDEGRKEEIDTVLEDALRSASPPGPALVIQIALRALDKSDTSRALAAIEDAMGLEPLTTRDDDARLDAAALLMVLAEQKGDKRAMERAREALGSAETSTGAYWRGEALRAYAMEDIQRAELASQVVILLIPSDSDLPRLRENQHNRTTALQALIKARNALDKGDASEAVRCARHAVFERSDLGVCHAVLAEALNATRDRGAIEAGKKATLQNPALIDGWRELGDAYMEARQASNAESSFREALVRDPNYSLAQAKLAQALLEQGRSREALQSLNSAEDRGGDAFLVSAIRGDILAEMNRHTDAAEAYERALRIEPEDHWVLHQAALEQGRAGNDERAIVLFEQALRFDYDGCHQTLVDYGDLLRRMGRIGDAVRQYRKAVTLVPNESDWRRALREAEQDLMNAPN